MIHSSTTGLHAQSPDIWSNKPSWNPVRLLRWTLPRRYHEYMAKAHARSLSPAFGNAGARVSLDGGIPIENTGVTTGQLEMLLTAVQASEGASSPIAEIGSFRGKTTRALASATNRQILAIDPYLGEGGHEKDLAHFREQTSGLSNVRHLRLTSHEARKEWGNSALSMVFIDAIHEYLHAWYDFAAWGGLIQPGGFAAFHDVDLFPGVNRTCQRILRELPEWRPWAHVPNLAIFQLQKS